MAGLLSSQRKQPTGGLLSEPITIDQRVAGLLGLDPTIERGAILPMGRDANGEMVLAWPQMAVDSLKSLMLPGHVMKGGSFTPRDVTEMALDVGMLSSVVPGPAGAKRMFGGRSKPSADLPMDEASRMARAKEMGFNVDAYHGTHATNLKSFSQSKGDIGTHLGTYEQANNRLLATGEAGKAGHVLRKFDSGANVIPAKIRLENPLDLPDVGTWNDSAVVAQELARRGKLKDRSILDAAVEAKNSAGNSGRFVKSRVNKSLLNDIRKDLESQGYDGVRYKNIVENEYGDHASMRPDVAEYKSKLNAEIKAIESSAYDRMPQLPDAPTEADIQRFLDAKLEDFITDAEKKKIGELTDNIIRLSKDETSYHDPHSYIVFDPSHIRSRFAAFDPAKRDSTDILASYLGVPGIGMLDAMPQDQPQRDVRGLLNY